MAHHFGCSVKTIYKKCYNYGLKLRYKYFECTKAELQEEVRRLHNEFPNAGSRVINYEQTGPLLCACRITKFLLEAKEKL